MTHDSATLPPVLFLHGLFAHPALLGPWVEFLSAAGFTCHTPALPGRDPVDRAALRRVRLADYVQAAIDAYDELDDTPVVIGHSIGGLLGQRIAAVRPCRALVLLASVPPGILWTRPVALPYLIALLPAILAGRPILPSMKTFREIPLNGLPAQEQDELIARFVPDSGRVFRAMALGTRPTRVKRNAVSCPVLCVSGGADRNVANQISRRIAHRYNAEHQHHPRLPRWIIASSALADVAPPVAGWLTKTLQPSSPGTGASTDRRARQADDRNGLARKVANVSAASARPLPSNG